MSYHPNVARNIPASADRIPPPRGDARARDALPVGAMGGPLFVTLVVVQMAVVPWFDITRQPLSVLSVGETSWLQKAAFVLGGLLIVIGARGLRWALGGTPGGGAGVALVGVFGVGLLASGVFDVDPGDGAPPGSPVLEAADYSWHMYAHNMSSMVAFICLSIACFVFVRRFARLRQRGWVICSLFVGISTPVLFFLPLGQPSLRLAIATVFMLTWTTALFLSIRAASRPTI